MLLVDGRTFDEVSAYARRWIIHSDRTSARPFPSWSVAAGRLGACYPEGRHSPDLRRRRPGALFPTAHANYDELPPHPTGPHFEVEPGKSAAKL